MNASQATLNGSPVTPVSHLSSCPSRSWSKRSQSRIYLPYFWLVVVTRNSLLFQAIHTDSYSTKKWFISSFYKIIFVLFCNNTRNSPLFFFSLKRWWLSYLFLVMYSQYHPFIFFSLGAFQWGVQFHDGIPYNFREACPGPPACVPGSISHYTVPRKCLWWLIHPENSVLHIYCGKPLLFGHRLCVQGFCSQHHSLVKDTNNALLLSAWISLICLVRWTQTITHVWELSASPKDYCRGESSTSSGHSLQGTVPCSLILGWVLLGPHWVSHNCL
jgi:hypothetical protein